MANWYQKIIVPRLLNSKMGSETHEKIRRETLVEASGIVLEIGAGPGYNFPFYEKIPLPDCSVDTVISTWTLCSVAVTRKVLSEVARVLKPQGKFVFVDHGASPHFGILILQMAFTSVNKYFTGNCHHDRQIEKLIIEAGLDIKKIKYPHD